MVFFKMKTGISSLRLSALSLALLSAFSAHAQSESSGTLKEVVVTANRSEQLLTDAIPNTTVIGRDVIDRSQATDLVSLLASEASIQFVQNGGRGSSATIYLRGAASLQVLVLVDGVSLTRQDTTGSVGVENIMLDQVDRVEIVRGNVSAIYGSGAIGGVVQIFTRAATGKPLAYASVEVGSLSSVRSSAGISGGFEKTKYTLGVGQQKTDGFSAMNPKQYPSENPDADGFKNTNYNLGITQEILKGHSFGLRAQGSDAEFDFDGGGFGASQDIHKGRSTLNTWQIFSHNQINKAWESKFSYSESSDQSVADALKAPSYPYYSDAITKSKTSNWTNTIAIDDWLITAGLENQNQGIALISRDDYSSTNLNRARDVMSFFGGLSGLSGPHSFQLNARNDKASSLDGNNTGYLGYGYQLNPSFKLLASSSTAFNLPTLGYLFDPSYGNPNLLPETARSSELGLQWANEGQVLRATSFNTITSNLLVFDLDSYKFSNVSNVANKGVEISYSGNFNTAKVRASLTSQDPINQTTGKRLDRRPDTMASIGFSIPVSEWSVGADIRYTGSRPDKTKTLSAYSVLDLKARYSVTKEIDLTARIDNALDEDYQTAFGYNQPRRAGYVGLVWKQK
jgi:vitamin B12 transporter